MSLDPAGSYEKESPLVHLDGEDETIELGKNLEDETIELEKNLTELCMHIIICRPVVKLFYLMTARSCR
jgi:hypothetical protein